MTLEQALLQANQLGRMLFDKQLAQENEQLEAAWDESEAIDAKIRHLLTETDEATVEAIADAIWSDGNMSDRFNRLVAVAGLRMPAHGGKMDGFEELGKMLYNLIVDACADAETRMRNRAFEEVQKDRAIAEEHRAEAAAEAAGWAA